MKPENTNESNLIKRFKNLPGYIRLIIIFSVISWLISAVLGIITNVKTLITGKTETQLSLHNFESEYHDFQIKLPNTFPPPYESRSGIHNDSNLILEFFENSYSQSTYEIARIELPDAELSKIVEWVKKRALDITDTTIDSIEKHDTSAYAGTLLKYTILKAGYTKEDRECRDWVTYVKPYGYSIRICTSPNDWKRLEEPSLEIFESFLVKGNFKEGD